MTEFKRYAFVAIASEYIQIPYEDLPALLQALKAAQGVVSLFRHSTNIPEQRAPYRLKETSRGSELSVQVYDYPAATKAEVEQANPAKEEANHD